MVKMDILPEIEDSSNLLYTCGVECLTCKNYSRNDCINCDFENRSLGIECPIFICTRERFFKSCKECNEYKQCTKFTDSIKKCIVGTKECMVGILPKDFNTNPIFIKSDFKFPSFFDKGATWIVKDNVADYAFKSFVYFLRKRIPGLCITRMHPSKLRSKYGINKTPVIWISSQKYEDVVSIVALNQILDLTRRFLNRSENGIILLNGLEYLTIENDFKSAMMFLHRLRDLVSISSSRLIVTVNPMAFSEKELALLETESDVEEASERIASYITGIGINDLRNNSL